MINFGAKYDHLNHGALCACNSAQAMAINKRLTAAMSRRSFLLGAGAVMAAASSGIIKPAYAQEVDKPVLLKNVSIFDGLNDKLISGKNILIKGDKITAVVAK